jgi:hypothetical protein
LQRNRAGEIVEAFLQRRSSGNVVEGSGLVPLPLCEIPQATVTRGESCRDRSEKPWCFVENDTASARTPAGRCTQALVLSAAAQELAGVRFHYECVQ